MECNEKLEIIREFGQLIVHERDFTKLIELLTALVTKLAKADRSSIFIYDKKRDELYTIVAEGLEFEISVPVEKSIAGDAIRERKIQVVKDVKGDHRFNDEIDKKTGYKTKNIIACPLFNSKDELLGTIEVLNKDDTEFGDDDISAIRLFSNFIAYVLENKTLNEDMEEIIEKRTKVIQELNLELEEEIRLVRKLSVIDSLTQIYNRQKIDTVLMDEIQKAQKGNKKLSLILFDVDDFKAINDTFGHLSGDRVLKEIAKKVMDNLPKGMFFGRWGGEEFIVIAPDADASSAIKSAENLRHVITTILSDAGEAISCSFGAAEFKTGMTADDLIKDADQAMYRAKTEGKNRVSFTYCI